jgi:hypothetical protein
VWVRVVLYGVFYLKYLLFVRDEKNTARGWSWAYQS